jgi:hypothetical protein
MLRVIVLGLLTFHTAMTVWATRTDSIWMVFPPFQQDYVWQIFSDLVTALGLFYVVCWADIKRRHLSPVGFWISLLMTWPLGSFAPLIWLLWDRKILSKD